MQIRKLFHICEVGKTEVDMEAIRSYLYLRKNYRVVYVRRYAVSKYLKSIEKEEWLEKLKRIFMDLKFEKGV